jgi:2'-5' RNA ligase
MKNHWDNRRESDRASTVRLFFAVDLEEEARAQVARESSEIRRAFDTELRKNGGAGGAKRTTGRRLAWVSENNYHLTVKFLGATKEDKVSAVIQAAQNALSDVESFEIEVSGVGAFPHVLWLEVKERAEESMKALPTIAQKLDQALEPLGFAREMRAFVPHLTLARLKEGKPIRADRDLKSEWRERSLGVSTVREVILYKSDTRPTGAVYEPVARIPLREKAG